jgi:hypothetical protein
MNSNKKTVVMMVFVAFLFVFFTSCKTKFNKQQWDEHPDLAFSPPFRNGMLTDLTTNHPLVGLHYSELIKLLGKPNFSDRTSMSYTIITDYGSDIDPVYVKNLSFQFSADSVITSFVIDEWKK